jgi:hypothetical protein
VEAMPCVGAASRPRGANRLVCSRIGEGMGILDEAIREHLELKRQHGADDSELKQIEDEAFGPPGRPGDELPAAGEAAEGDVAPSEAPTEYMPAPEVEGAPAQAPAAPEMESSAEAQSSPEPAPPAAEDETPPVEQPTEFYDVEAGIAASQPAPAAPEPLEAEISESDDIFDEQSLSDELDQALDSTEQQPEPEPEPEEGLEPAEEELEPPPNPGPAESPPEDAPASTESGEQEDVLEETPEFLQDTPESDRLWFEQKPPKDFDFDD